MNLINLFDLSLKDRKNKKAIEFNGQSFTFGEMDQRSNQMAHFLINKGLVSGDRICVYLENCVEMIDLYIACAKIGVIFVPINILYKEREVTHILSDAEPKLLFADVPVPGGFEAIQLEDLIVEVSRQSDEPINVRTTGDSPAAIVYTSGTTGMSKGAILMHNNFISNGQNLVTCWKITEDDKFLLALPLFHVHSLANGIHSWLISGCEMKLLVLWSSNNLYQIIRPTQRNCSRNRKKRKIVCLRFCAFASASNGRF